MHAPSRCRRGGSGVPSPLQCRCRRPEAWAAGRESYTYLQTPIHPRSPSRLRRLQREVRRGPPATRIAEFSEAFLGERTAARDGEVLQSSAHQELDLLTPTPTLTVFVARKRRDDVCARVCASTHSKLYLLRGRALQKAGVSSVALNH